MATIEELESLRSDLRRDCVDIIMAGAGGHIGGDMSVIDALMTLYANHLNISPETVDDLQPRSLRALQGPRHGGLLRGALPRGLS